jgi:hypothetical protein
MIFVPNVLKPTQYNISYVAKILAIFGAKMADYGSCGYFARGLSYNTKIMCENITMRNNKSVGGL